MNDDISGYVSHQAVKLAFHQEEVLKKEIGRALEELKSINRANYNSSEMNDLLRHFDAISALPQLLTMLEEEIQIVRRHGPRKVSWWDMIDEHY